jgi:hypothetical protein
MLKFRSYNRLIGNGFSKKLLDIVSSEHYQLPVFESGNDYVQYYITHPEEVESGGFILYIFSTERGKGKTTLAHYLMWRTAMRFSSTENYRRERSLSFGFNRSREILGNEGAPPLPTFQVLDDLGSEPRIPLWKKELVISDLQELLHYRRDKHLPTVITSNYHPSNLSNLYDGVVDSLLEIRPDGLIGGSLARQVELGGGEDLRLLDTSGWPV